MACYLYYLQYLQLVRFPSGCKHGMFTPDFRGRTAYHIDVCYLFVDTWRNKNITTTIPARNIIGGTGLEGRGTLIVSQRKLSGEFARAFLHFYGTGLRHRRRRYATKSAQNSSRLIPRFFWVLLLVPCPMPFSVDSNTVARPWPPGQPPNASPYANLENHD